MLNCIHKHKRAKPHGVSAENWHTETAVLVDLVDSVKDIQPGADGAMKKNLHFDFCLAEWRISQNSQQKCD